MSEKRKQIHKNFCDYEIAKANKRVRTYSTTYKPKNNGIRTSGLSKAMLAQQLAALF